MGLYALPKSRLRISHSLSLTEQIDDLLHDTSIDRPLGPYEQRRFGGCRRGAITQRVRELGLLRTRLGHVERLETVLGVQSRQVVHTSHLQDLDEDVAWA